MRAAWTRQEKVLRQRDAALNKKRRPVTFSKGDLVMLYEPSMARKSHAKKQLALVFTGPHKVLRRATSRSYVVSIATDTGRLPRTSKT